MVVVRENLSSSVQLAGGAVAVLLTVSDLESMIFCFRSMGDNRKDNK